MGKIRRAGYVVISYKGDHDPRHVHIFQRGREIAKYNLQQGSVMSGKVNARLLKVLRELRHEGKV